MQYKFNPSRAVFDWLKSLAIIIVLSIGAALIFSRYRSDSLPLVIAFFILIYLPIIILFFSYYSTDNNVFLIIDKTLDLFEYHKGENVKHYLRSDIKSIECIVPPAVSYTHLTLPTKRIV